jgi:hypothetical protein
MLKLAQRLPLLGRRPLLAQLAKAQHVSGFPWFRHHHETSTIANQHPIDVFSLFLVSPLSDSPRLCFLSPFLCHHLLPSSPPPQPFLAPFTPFGQTRECNFPDIYATQQMANLKKERCDETKTWAGLIGGGGVVVTVMAAIWSW